MMALKLMLFIALPDKIHKNITSIHKNFLSASGWPGSMTTNIFKCKRKVQTQCFHFSELKSCKEVPVFSYLTDSGKIILGSRSIDNYFISAQAISYEHSH